MWGFWGKMLIVLLLAVGFLSFFCFIRGYRFCILFCKNIVIAHSLSSNLDSLKNAALVRETANYESMGVGSLKTGPKCHIGALLLLGKTLPWLVPLNIVC